MKRQRKTNIPVIIKAIIVNKFKLLIVSLFALAAGFIYTGINSEKSYYSETNITIKKVCELAVLSGICDIIESDEICVEVYEQLRSNEIKHIDGNYVTLLELQEGIRAINLREDYKIIVRFTNSDYTIVNSVMNLVMDDAIDYINKNNAHYKNNIETVVVNHSIYNKSSYNAYKILFIWLYVSILYFSMLVINEVYDPTIIDKFDISEDGFDVIESKIPFYKKDNELVSFIKRRKKDSGMYSKTIVIYTGGIKAFLNCYAYKKIGENVFDEDEFNVCKVVVSKSNHNHSSIKEEQLIYNKYDETFNEEDANTQICKLLDKSKYNVLLVNSKDIFCYLQKTDIDSIVVVKKQHTRTNYISFIKKNERKAHTYFIY